VTDRPLRIAHVTATFPPYYGGTGNVCYHNARVLAARGHDVQVFTADWQGKVDDPQGVTVHRLRRFGGVGNAPLLPGLLRLGPHDVVHLHFPFYGGGELVALGRRPYVVTYHQDVLIDGWRGRLTGAHDRLVGRRVLTHAARICPTSLDYARSSGRSPTSSPGSGIGWCRSPTGSTPRASVPVRPIRPCGRGTDCLRRCRSFSSSGRWTARTTSRGSRPSCAR
jgi:glycosyltransferase involved in cell wall biosynthesis